MSEKHHVQSAARVAATLRTVLRGFRTGGEHAVPLLIGDEDGGQPEAVLLPYDLFQALCANLDVEEDMHIARLAAERLINARPEGTGIDTEALARLVAAERPDDEEALLRASRDEPGDGQ